MFIDGICYSTDKFTNQEFALNESTIIHRMASGYHDVLWRDSPEFHYSEKIPHDS